jgi:hypothetical protein
MSSTALVLLKKPFDGVSIPLQVFLRTGSSMNIDELGNVDAEGLFNFLQSTETEFWGNPEYSSSILSLCTGLVDLLGSDPHLSRLRLVVA